MALIVAIGNPVYDQITTPVVATRGRVLSGCSTNACLALARLGRQAVLVGRIGPDFQQAFVADMARFGAAAITYPDAETGGFRLIYDQRGDRTLQILGVAGPISQLPDAIKDAAAIIIGPILQETPLSLIQEAAAQGSAPLFLDPQGLLRRMHEDTQVEHYLPADMPAIARYCHVIKANELEAYVLTGIDPRVNVAAAARAIRDMGCAIAIVTLAEAGSFIDDGHQQMYIPAYATEVRDPTGAGDTYLAGFVHSYLRAPSDLYRAGCTGAAVASIWIEHSGPDVPLTPAEVARRMEQLLRDYPTPKS